MYSTESFIRQYHAYMDIEDEMKVQVVGVMQIDSYHSCLLCKARVEPCTPPHGRCRMSNDAAF